MKLETIKKYFFPSSILDIGANKGQFRQLALDVFPGCEILSIEANPNCEPYLRRLTNDFVIALLAKDETTYDFHVSKVNPTSTGNSIYRELTPHFSDSNSTSVQVKASTLDNLLCGRTFDLVKIDTQGSELDIISGGRSTCQLAKGVLLETSVIPYNSSAPLHDEVVSFMYSMGFDVGDVVDVKRKSYELDGKKVDVFQQDVLFLNRKYFNLKS